MKKNLMFSLLAGSMLLLAACKSGTDKPETGTPAAEETTAGATLGTTRYSMKSAKVTTVMLMPGGMGTNTTTLFFDDYGKKEMRENVSAIKMAGREMNTTMRTIIRDGYIYTWTVGQKTGNKIKMDLKFDPSNIDYKDLTEEMMAKFKMKDEGTATVLDKTCRVFSFETEGMKGKSYVWENIPMKMEMSVSGQTMTAEVTKLEEGVSIPASEFELPADVEFKEMQVPQTMHP